MTTNQAIQPSMIGLKNSPIPAPLPCPDSQISTDIAISPPDGTSVIFGEAASKWFKFGFDVIPLVSDTKRPALSWSPWFDDLSSETIEQYWSAHPDHELAFKVGDDLIVFDTDSLEATKALWRLEQEHGCPPYMVVKTTKGEHHYFKRGKDTYARSDSHSTETHPERIDVKTGRALITLPPSTGKVIEYCQAGSANELTEASQKFIDAVSLHNGRIPPRPIENESSEAEDAIIPDETVLAKLDALLIHIDPDDGYEDWLHVLMAIHHETGGSEAGFDIADAWCRRGEKYGGTAEIRMKWRSFQPDRSNTFNIGTLINMVKANGIDWMSVCSEAAEPFETCDTEVQHPGQMSHTVATTQGKSDQAMPMEIIMTSNRLDQYSLRGMSDELEKSVVDDVLLLGQLALLGQATVLFAAPNTGKTVITLNLLVEAIKEGRVDPSKVYYLNMDDSAKGLLEKNRIAEEFNFHMLAEGQRDFSAREFISIVRDMIENDQARGVVIILDTLKKFVDLMDKGRTSAFTNVIRPFVMKGGTVIALAHTNKNPGKDGKPVYGGVSDILNDIDCAYTIAPVSAEGGVKVVEFANVKRRGSVIDSTAYSYCVGNGIPYNEILLSVQLVDQTALDPLKQAEAIKSDAEVISAVTACIGEGVCSKMLLADATAKRVGISKRAAIQVIEKYTGEDPALHRWTFSVRDRGAKVFALLNSLPPAQAPEIQNN